jgi:hypothetical protein
MIPEKVLNAVYEQLRPLIIELAKYNKSPNDSVVMEFLEGFVRFDFKDKDETSN